mgnify:CR=1 FL=1
MPQLNNELSYATKDEQCAVPNQSFSHQSYVKKDDASETVLIHRFLFCLNLKIPLLTGSDKLLLSFHLMDGF